MAMPKVEIEVDVQDNSLDNSGDGELLGMVEGGSFESTGERSHLVSQSFLETNDEEYHFKDLPGNVTYKIVQMTSGEESANNMSHSPPHIVPGAEYYVIGNPVEVFGTTVAPKKSLLRDPLQANPNKAKVVSKKRDDKRRATHNEVERRRRDKINSWITKLAGMVPNAFPDGASKGGILAKACDHIADLTEKQKKLEKLEVENEKLVLEILRLNQELTELRKENSTMRNQLADNCILIQHRTSKDQKS